MMLIEAISAYLLLITKFFLKIYVMTPTYKKTPIKSKPVPLNTNANNSTVRNEIPVKAKVLINSFSLTFINFKNPQNKTNCIGTIESV